MGQLLKHERTLAVYEMYRVMPLLCQALTVYLFVLAQREHAPSTFISVLASLPEGAWGNRLRFLQSGARGRSASLEANKVTQKPIGSARAKRLANGA